MPWLKYSSVSRDIESAASVDEKALFFEIMEHFGFPAEYYEPVPTGTAIPDMRIATYGEGRIGGIVDDGGLAAEQNPVGKTFVLIGQYGLKTTLQILRQGDNGRGKKCAFWGMGTIEGNRSIIPRYRKDVVPGAHTAENHDFISSDQGSRSSISKSLFCSARSGIILSR